MKDQDRLTKQVNLILKILMLILMICNVPIFGCFYVTEWDACQSSQMGVIVSSRDIEGFYWARLASFIIFHHQDPFRTTCLWFCCILTISVILSYYGAYFN
jgi:hypothetical protein